MAKQSWRKLRRQKGSGMKQKGITKQKPSHVTSADLSSTASVMEKVYITPSPMGFRLHNLPTYETVYITS
jgi:hypothetical protein